jgi:hypothetical protein
MPLCMAPYELLPPLIPLIQNMVPQHNSFSFFLSLIPPQLETRSYSQGKSFLYLFQASCQVQVPSYHSFDHLLSSPPTPPAAPGSLVEILFAYCQQLYRDWDRYPLSNRWGFIRRIYRIPHSSDEDCLHSLRYLGQDRLLFFLCLSLTLLLSQLSPPPTTVMGSAIVLLLQVLFLFSAPLSTNRRRWTPLRWLASNPIDLSLPRLLAEESLKSSTRQIMEWISPSRSVTSPLPIPPSCPASC